MVNFRKCSANGLSFKEYAEDISRKMEEMKDMVEVISRFDHDNKNFDEAAKLAGKLEYNWPRDPIDFWNIESFRSNEKVCPEVREKIDALINRYNDSCGVVLDIGSGRINIPNTISMDYAYNSLKLNGNKNKVAADANARLPFRDRSVCLLCLIFSYRFIDLNILLNESRRVLNHAGKLLIVDSDKTSEWYSPHYMNNYSADDLCILLAGRRFRIERRSIVVGGEKYQVIIAYK